MGLISQAQAGDAVGTYTPGTEATPVPVETNEPDAFSSWLTPSLDMRLRYEYRKTDPVDSANAVTFRVRPGILLGDFNGFSAFGEIEATQPLWDDYTGGAGTSPNEGNTQIADPENVELNRAWVQYKGNGFMAKVGRQRIIRNDAYHIGNVGWRQNEQTFDAAQIAYSNDDFSISYVYSNRAQRIFGDDAGGYGKEAEGDFHFIDGSFKTPIGKVGAYAYLIDVENNTSVGESNTFGGFTNLGPVFIEAAFQDGSSTLAGGDYDAFLVRGKYTLKTDVGAFTAGIDYFTDNYKTPFQTAHAPHGFADRFLGQQIGLNKANGFDGMFDAHLKYAKPGLPGGITFKGALHYFADANLEETYGYEADAVLVKKFTDNLTGLLKAAYFIGDEGSAFNDIKQVSVQLDYKF
ncbi:MAG: alginate export family protein [Verrucomicrobiota bacterium]